MGRADLQVRRNFAATIATNGFMTTEAPDKILAEQLAYYGARAPEYDQWWLRQGRYDRGATENAQWFREIAEVDAALHAFKPAGQVLELACGTGLWTEKLLPFADHVTAVDGSTEVLAANAARTGAARITRIRADLFNWQPDRQFDVVFFAFWLSHVPPDLFESFWQLVGRCLKPGGRFFFVDSRRTPLSTAVDHVLPAPEVTVMPRRLDDGREFQVYKVFYEAASLADRLNALGWDSASRETKKFFIHGQGSFYTA